MYQYSSLVYKNILTFGKNRWTGLALNKEAATMKAIDKALKRINQGCYSSRGYNTKGTHEKGIGKYFNRMLQIYYKEFVYK